MTDIVPVVIPRIRDLRHALVPADPAHHPRENPGPVLRSASASTGDPRGAKDSLAFEKFHRHALRVNHNLPVLDLKGDRFRIAEHLKHGFWNPADSPFKTGAQSVTGMIYGEESPVRAICQSCGAEDNDLVDLEGDEVCRACMARHREYWTCDVCKIYAYDTSRPGIAELADGRQVCKKCEEDLKAK